MHVYPLLLFCNLTYSLETYLFYLIKKIKCHIGCVQNLEVECWSGCVAVALVNHPFSKNGVLMYVCIYR
jgi:hypothetical protein